MMHLKQAICACVLASALVPTVAAQASTYYVATTGSNSNPGTSSQPWGTIAYATSKMVAGDTTYVRGGVYKETKVDFRRSGTSTAPIRLLNYPGEAPIIDCVDNTSAGINQITIYAKAGERHAIGWIVIEGFEIRHCWRAIKFYNLHDSVIRRNFIHHTTKGPLQGSGARILIDRNIIAHIGDGTGGPNGIYANGTAFTITNNLFYDIQYYAIQQNGSSSSRYDPAIHSGPEMGDARDWIVANNTFAYNGKMTTSGAYVVWGGRCHNLRIENNIFYENNIKGRSSPAQIYFVSPSRQAGVQIRNNLAYSTRSGLDFLDASAVEGTHYTQSGNVVNVANPEFVNAPATLPDSPNFALTERSPAIDAGVTLAETKTAFDGTTRPQGHAYDIGAYEYSAGRDSEAPKPVEKVEIR